MSKTAKILKTVLIVLLFAGIGALFLRMCQQDNKELEDLIITDNFKNAYKDSADIRTHDLSFSENGAIYAYSLAYVEKSGYIQFSVRYNTRHIDEVIKEYPDFKEDKISYKLVDSKGNTYIPTIIGRAEKYNYRYFKLEFENVDMSDDKLTLIMVLEGLDFNGGELVIHSKGRTSIPYNITKKQSEELSK